MHQTTYRFGEFELDPASRELRHHGEPVSLPPKSFECLVYLIEHRERAVGRDELISAVWGRVDASDAGVAQTLLRARRAIGDTGNEQAAVRTVPRFGYRWVAPLEVLGEGARETAAVAPGPAAAASVDTPAGVLPVVASETETPAIAAGGDRQPHTTPNPRRWWWLGAALLVAAILAVLFWRLRPQPARAPVSELAIVLPVEIAPGDAEHAWIRLGAMDYIASRLRRNGGLTVLPSEQVLRLTGHDAAERDATDFVERLRATTGARWILSPTATRNAQGWRLRLQVSDAEGVHDFDALGDTPLAAAATVSDAMLRRLGRVRDSAPAPTALTERLQQVDAELLAGQLATARALIQGAPATQRNDPQLRVREGQVEFRVGHVDEAAASYTALLARAGSLPGDVHADALMGLGAVAIRRADFAEAERRYTQALQELDQNTGHASDPTLRGHAYNGRGIARIELGRIDEAIADLGRARIAMQRAGDEIEAAAVGNNIGLLEARRGQNARALQEFDRAIATFERFDVRDNLAATLQAKARTELRLLQPDAALADSARAAELGRQIENPYLQDIIDLAHVDALLANGHLREASDRLQQLQRRDHPHPLTLLPALQLRLLLSLGRSNDAHVLARQLLEATEPPDDAQVLLAVQAALGQADLALARAWLQRLAPPPGGQPVAFEPLLARALVAAASGDHADAARGFEAARAAVADTQSPADEVRAGCAQVAYLVAQGQLDRAGAVMGELSSFTDRDYRAARTALALYRALDDRALQATAVAQVRKLAGERNPALPVVL